MQQTKRATAAFLALAAFVFMSITFAGCGGSQTDEVSSDTISTPVDTGSMMIDSLPPGDSSLETRPEGTRTRSK